MQKLKKIIQNLKVKTINFKTTIMKKQIYLVLGLLFLVLIQGCEKSSEQFSCDEQVHDWTVKNLAVLENMNRAELATLPFAYQRAALRAFAPEKKYEIWNEKLDIVLAQQWDDDELLLIQELEKNLIPDFFSQSNMQQTHLYLNDWANRMFQETNMDSITFVLSFMHICTFEEIELLLYPPQNESISGEDGSGGQRVPDPPGPVYSEDCDCDWDITCSLINMGLCNNDKCNTTIQGCGLFWMYSCKNRCSGEDPSL